MRVAVPETSVDCGSRARGSPAGIPRAYGQACMVAGNRGRQSFGAVALHGAARGPVRPAVADAPQNQVRCHRFAVLWIRRSRAECAKRRTCFGSSPSRLRRPVDRAEGKSELQIWHATIPAWTRSSSVSASPSTFCSRSGGCGTRSCFSPCTSGSRAIRSTSCYGWPASGAACWPGGAKGRARRGARRAPGWLTGSTRATRPAAAA